MYNEHKKVYVYSKFVVCEGVKSLETVTDTQANVALHTLSSDTRATISWATVSTDNTLPSLSISNILRKVSSSESSDIGFTRRSSTFT
jgi:hypothetical protein